MKKYTYLITFLIIGIFLLSAGKRKPKQQENIPNYFSLSDSNGKIIGVIDSEITPFSTDEFGNYEVPFSIINIFSDVAKIQLRPFNSAIMAVCQNSSNASCMFFVLIPKEEKKLLLKYHHNRAESGKIQTGMRISIDCGKDVIVENFLEIRCSKQVLNE